MVVLRAARQLHAPPASEIAARQLQALSPKAYTRLICTHIPNQRQCCSCWPDIYKVCCYQLAADAAMTTLEETLADEVSAEGDQYAEAFAKAQAADAAADAAMKDTAAGEAVLPKQRWDFLQSIFRYILHCFSRSARSISFFWGRGDFRKKPGFSGRTFSSLPSLQIGAPRWRTLYWDTSPLFGYICKRRGQR